MILTDLVQLNSFFTGHSDFQISCQKVVDILLYLYFFSFLKASEFGTMDVQKVMDILL